MKPKIFSSLFFAGFAAITALGQPSYEGPPPSRAVVQDADIRREQYLQRINEVRDWRINKIDFTAAEPKLDMATVGMLLARGEHVDACNKYVIESMKEPGSGPFWMFPSVCVAYTGRNLLSPEAQAAIRQAWTHFQIRGDTENHWAMYYISLYLMCQLYPDDPADSWFNGKSSAENMAESREYLISWMDLATTVGQGEYNPTHYIGEYAIPLLFLSTWGEDPAMRQRGHMMLDWVFAGLAENTLNGVLRGPNSRTDDTSVIERWNALASFFSWMLFGNTPPTSGYGGWGNYFATVGDNYYVPEVIYRIATDRDKPFLQRDLKRSRRIWRYSDTLCKPIYKTSYLSKNYAVGSYQGGMSDPIQSHVWDVTWDVPDPRGVHNSIFSVHAYSSNHAMQTFFAELPDTMAKGVSREGKPSYDWADKWIGCSPYERVFQDLDTVIALYDIPPGTRFPHVNGFFSKDLKDVTEDSSGWIFARGGKTYLAYRPLAGYTMKPALLWKRKPSKEPGYHWTHEDKGDQLLQSPHLKNGTIVQAADEGEFKSFDAFKAVMRALPLEYKLDPMPTVEMTTLRGKHVVFTYGEVPVVDGQAIDYSKWKLFEGPYLNAEVGSRKLTITHGRLQRVLDFNTLTISDTVTP